MSRSLSKLNFVQPHLLKKWYAYIKLLKRGIKRPKIKFVCRNRSSLILPHFVGLPFEIYNGQKYVSFVVRKEMVGHKFGEFSYTKKRVVHKVKVAKGKGKTR